MWSRCREDKLTILNERGDANKAADTELFSQSSRDREIWRQKRYIWFNEEEVKEIME